METPQPRAPLLGRIGWGFAGGMLGLGVGIVGSTMLAKANGSDVAWALGMGALVVSAPFTVGTGIFLGARFAPKPAVDQNGVVIPVRPLRSAPPAAWAFGIIAGLIAFVVLFAFIAVGVQMLSTLIGLLWPQLNRVITALAVLFAIWAAVVFAARVIRWVAPDPAKAGADSR